MRREIVAWHPDDPASFLCNGDHYGGHNLPPVLHDALYDAPGAQRVYSFVFGPCKQYLAVIQQNFNAEPQLYMNDLPPKLSAWLLDAAGNCVRHLQSLYVTLGSGGSFFACDQHGFQWDKLPAALEKTLQDSLTASGWKHPPRVVALGAKGSFLYTNSVGNMKYKLAGCYKELGTDIKSTTAPLLKPELLDYAVLCLDGTGYMCVLEDGTFFANSEAIDSIAAALGDKLSAVPYERPTRPDALAAEVQSLKASLNAADSRITSLKTVLDQKDAKAKQHDGTRAEAKAANARVLEFEAALKQWQTHSETLEAANATLRARVEALEAANTEAAERIADLEDRAAQRPRTHYAASDPGDDRPASSMLPSLCSAETLEFVKNLDSMRQARERQAGLSAAHALRQANAQTNRDFLLRQQAQQAQFQQQQQQTMMMNIQTQMAAVNFNASSMPIW